MEAPQPGEHDEARPVVGIVFPPDTRQRVTQTLVFPYSAIGRLTMTFPNGKTYSGTGTLITNQDVLTAAHNLWGSDLGGNGWAQKVFFAPAQNGASQPFGNRPAAQAFVTEEYITAAPPSPLNTPDGTVTDYTRYLWDFGLVHLAEPVPDSCGHCDLASLSDQQLTSSSVRITGYPGDLAQTYGTGTMWTATGPVTVSQDDDLIFYTISTYKGQSGAGLMVAQQTAPVVCGVHVAGSATLASNFAVRLNESNVAQVNAWLAATATSVGSTAGPATG